MRLPKYKYNISRRNFLPIVNNIINRNLFQLNTEGAKPANWENAKPFEEIPGPKPLPIFGNMWRFLPGFNFYKMGMLQFVEKLHKDYGNIVVLKGLFGLTDSCFLFDPVDYEYLFRNQGPTPIRKATYAMEYYRNVLRKDFFGDTPGLVSFDPKKWYNFRSQVNPILMNPKSDLYYVGGMEEVANDLVQLIRTFANQNSNGELPEDFERTINKWSLESIATVALNRRLGCLNPNLPKNSKEYIFVDSALKTFECMYELDIKPSIWKYVSTPKFREFVRLVDTNTKIALEFIDEAIIKLEKRTCKKSEAEISILEKLLKLDRKIAVVMMMDIFLSGVDTSSRIMSSALYLIARYPEKQKLLREEALRLLPTKNTPITKEILEKTHYLKAFIKETNRVAPLGIGTPRTIQRDMFFSGYQVPKETQVVAINFFAANSEKYVPRAKEFLPERWLRESDNSEISMQNINKFIFQYFGYGARSCVGKRLASLEFEIGILKIIRNFELSWPHKDMKFELKLLYGIADPLKIHVKELLG